MRTKKLNLSKEPFIVNQLRLLKPFEGLMRRALVQRGEKPETRLIYLVVQYYDFFNNFFADKREVKNKENKELYDLYKLSKSFTLSTYNWAKSKGIILPDTFSFASLLGPIKEIFGGERVQPVVIPPAPKKDNTMTYILIGGALIAAILIFKK